MVVIGGQGPAAVSASVQLLAWDGVQIRRATLADLPAPRMSLAAALSGEVILALGGQGILRQGGVEQGLEVGGSPRRLDARPLAGGGGRCRVRAGILPAMAGSLASVYVASGAGLSEGPSGTLKRAYLSDAFQFRPGHGWSPLPELPAPAVGPLRLPAMPADASWFSAEMMARMPAMFPTRAAPSRFLPARFCASKKKAGVRPVSCTRARVCPARGPGNVRCGFVARIDGDSRRREPSRHPDSACSFDSRIIRMTTTKFAGILPAVVTPFDENENFQPAAFERLLERLYATAIDGLYVNGQTGEACCSPWNNASG